MRASVSDGCNPGLDTRAPKSRQSWPDWKSAIEGYAYNTLRTASEDEDPTKRRLGLNSLGHKQPQITSKIMAYEGVFRLGKTS